MIQPQLIQRCIACRLRIDLCLCAASPRLPLATRLVMLMHAKEWRRASNTGHLARLAVQDAHIVLHGRIGQTLTAQDLPTANTHPILLFPSSTAAVLTPEVAAALPRPLSLIIPDGNWGQAKQMVKRIPGLAALPTVALPLAPAGVRRLRRNLTPDRMSTLEAVALALGLLEGPGIEARILKFYTQLVDRMLHMRGYVRADELTSS
jgi:DTW domain-containing protein YfiP